MWIHLPKRLHLNNTGDATFELNKSSWRGGGGGTKEREGVSLHVAPDYSRFVNTDKIFTFWIKKIIIIIQKICDDMCLHTDKIIHIKRIKAKTMNVS